MRRAKGPGLRFREKEGVTSTYKSAIVIIPPENCWKQIQEIRKSHDKAYSRWMPHINLIYPFLEDTTVGSQDVFISETQKLVKHLGSVNPFTIALTAESVGQFFHGLNTTVWVRPVVPASGDGENQDHVTSTGGNTSLERKSKKNKKKKPEKSYSVYSAPTAPSMSAPQVSAAGVVEVTGCDVNGYPPPISGPMHLYESSLDQLRHAEWMPDTKDKVAVPDRPGLDCLRFAEWTPENTKKPMFTHNMQKTRVHVTKASVPVLLEERRNVMEYSESEESESEEDESEEDEPFTEVVRTKKSASHHPDPLASHPGVMELQAKLQEVYPGLNELSTRSPEGFQPHLTLGQHKRGSQLLDHVKNTWQPVEFQVKVVHLISRPDDRTPFKIRQTVPLGAFSEM